MQAQQAHDRFIQECRREIPSARLADATIQGYMNTWRLFMQMVPICDIKQFNEGTLRQFFRKGVVDRGWKPATEATHRKNLSRFIEWCIQKKLIQKDPLGEIRYPKIIEQIPDFYTDEEVSKILYYADTIAHTPLLAARNKAIVAMLCLAGLRRSELTSCTLRDIDIVQQRIEIRGEEAKNRRPRVIKMSVVLRSYLEEYISEREKAGIDAYAFWASVRNEAFTNHGLKHLFRSLSDVSGVKVGAQKMRRTAGVNFYRGSKNVYATMDFLGHKDMQTTLRYIRATAEDMEEGVENNPLNLVF
jgi:integrase/recombinase XerD